MHPRRKRITKLISHHPPKSILFFSRKCFTLCFAHLYVYGFYEPGNPILKPTSAWVRNRFSGDGMVAINKKAQVMTYENHRVFLKFVNAFSQLTTDTMYILNYQVCLTPPTHHFDDLTIQWKLLSIVWGNRLLLSSKGQACSPHHLHKLEILQL